MISPLDYKINNYRINKIILKTNNNKRKIIINIF